MEYEALNENEPWHLTDTFTERRYKQMLVHVSKTSNTLVDIGIGAGRGGQLIRNQYPSSFLIGVDNVKNRLSIQTGQVYDQLVHSDDVVEKIQEDSVDVIFLAETLEHIPNKDIDHFLDFLFAVLKLEGRLIITTPNPNSLKMKLLRKTVLGGSHVSQHFQKILKYRLMEHGFRVRKIRGTGKTSVLLGTRFPIFFYGSYLLVAEKN
jgi:trans-aconitate methyltransferase